MYVLLYANDKDLYYVHLICDIIILFSQSPFHHNNLKQFFLFSKIASHQRNIGNVCNRKFVRVLETLT